MILITAGRMVSLSGVARNDWDKIVPQFQYVALDPAGHRKRGVIEAADRAAVIESLRRQGDIPVRAEPVSGHAGRLPRLNWQPRTGMRLSRSEVADFTRELSTMLAAGQDLDRALRFLVETAQAPRLKKVAGDIREAVRGGASLASALGAQPQSFNRLYVGLTRAGEAGGTLGATLERLALLLERQRSLRATVRSAMIYPTLLLVTAIGVIVILLTVVLPQFEPLFRESGASLPFATQALLSSGRAVGAYGPYVLVAGLVIVLAVMAALRDPNNRRKMDGLLLRLPVMGPLNREWLAAQFTRTLGTLLHNGVPLIGTLAIIREATTNLAAVQVIEQATESAKAGAGLARPLERSAFFPVRTIHLIRLGEETGQLATVALRAAEIHEEAVRLSVQRLVSLLVPVITLTMGVLVAGIVASLLLAMMSLNDLAG